MPRTSNPKRVRILETGKSLFWKHGFKRVTVEEICREAGISKMTFYKFFTNKMDLVVIYLDELFDASMAKYDMIMASDLPYPEKVKGMIDLKREQTHVMSNEFFRDFLQSGDPELISHLEEKSVQGIKKFTDDFREAQENGDVRKDLNIKFMMTIMNHLIEITQHDETLLNMFDEPQDLAVEMTKFIFYGILNREAPQ
jgi:AcrR family transcriptional regulator